jgi:hypothetical protein
MRLPRISGRARSQRRRHVGPGRDAARDAFELGEPARGVEGGLIADRHHLVDHRAVEHVRHEAGANALDLVRARVAAGEHRRVLSSTRDDAQAGTAGLQHLPDTRDGAAGADAGHEHVDLAVRVVPDLFCRGAAVNLRVRRVLELLGDHRAGNLALQLFRAGDRALHAHRAGGEHELGAQKGQHLAALEGHGLRHDEDEAVAAGSSHEGKRNAGVAGGGFDERGARLDHAGGFHGVHHAHADAVFHARDRIEELELHQHLALGAALLREAVEAHERRIADGLGDGAVDPGLGRALKA